VGRSGPVTGFGMAWPVFDLAMAGLGWADLGLGWTWLAWVVLGCHSRHCPAQSIPSQWPAQPISRPAHTIPISPHAQPSQCIAYVQPSPCPNQPMPRPVHAKLSHEKTCLCTAHSYHWSCPTQLMTTWAYEHPMPKPALVQHRPCPAHMPTLDHAQPRLPS
jgi:hypothetical protein